MTPVLIPKEQLGQDAALVYFLQVKHFRYTSSHSHRKGLTLTIRESRILVGFKSKQKSNFTADFGPYTDHPRAQNILAFCLSRDK